ncbi:acyl-CoA dehydrogenase family protein, partial [Bacillus altitudinis]|uniref:acyl-CoA dehydrogenase family protein n=1 Tax=Bacillus altitudinis TaxID=293387 RepID=UPI001643F6D2
MDVLVREKEGVWRKGVGEFAREHVLGETEGMEQGVLGKTVLAEMGGEGFLGIGMRDKYEGLGGDF